MDGAHDVGGMQGFGPATWPGASDPIHHRWELRAFALALASGPASAHRFRHAIETMGAVRYLEASYYERWLHVAEETLVASGAITPGDVDDWADRLGTGEVPPRSEAPEQARSLVGGLVTHRPRPPAAAPRFAVGERVRVVRMHPSGHTRCPRYLRGASGVVARVQCDDGVPDVDNAETEAVYAVEFRACDLWGDETGSHLVYADLWERYLEK